MLFNSWEYIFAFLPSALVAFFLFGKMGYHRLALSALLLCCIYFYGAWKAVYLLLIACSIVANYVLGFAIGAHEARSRRARYWLTAGIVFNLGLIGYFKYAEFFVSNVSALLDMDLRIGDVVLPLAISFFTFQQIAYLVDVYRGGKVERDPLTYALFVMFFPQLIAGPIVGHNQLIPQFDSRGIFRWNWDNIALGVTIFSIGLFKKVGLADHVAQYATPVFAAAEEGIELTFFEAWGGALAYTCQLYFDFSGYSDMAIGAAKLFNITLPVNFFSPYKATSIIEFWRRWHITLSTFLRSYLYIPLGGNRAGRGRTLVNLGITMLLGGLWHGAGWTFVLWGALHGSYLAANHSWRNLLQSLGADGAQRRWLYRAAAGVVTFIAVVVAWVMFRATSLEGAMVMYDAMFSFDRFVLTAKYVGKLESAFFFLPLEASEEATRLLDLRAARTVLQFLLICWLLPNTMQLADYVPKNLALTGWGRLLVWRPNPLWLSFVLYLSVYSMMQMTSISEFLYFQF